MGTISSGIGLISGIDYQTLIDQLIQVDSRPRDLLVQRMGTIDAQRTAYLDISARITALFSRIESLARASTFNAAKVTSSLPDVLSVSADAGAQPGTYSFLVRALATTHQAVSRGFHDRTAPLSPGSLTIESAQARVDRATRLDQLNGHTGVSRGKFRISDANGQEAVVSITDALTVGDVVDAINSAGIAVRASVRGDAFVLEDTSNGGTESLRVQEINGGRTAESLGFGAGYRYDTDGDGELAGSNVMYLAESSPLAALNDGLGVRRAIAGADFNMKVDGKQINVSLSDILKPDTRLARLNHGQGVRLGSIKITSRDGTFREVDLSQVTNISQVKDAIENAFDDGRLTVVLTSSRLMITDKTKIDNEDEAYDFRIEDVDGLAARDLGIAGTAETNKIDGRDILHMDTLADVINAIDYAAGNEDADRQPLVTASINDEGTGINLVSNAPGALVLDVPETSKSRALYDLGLRPGTYVDVGGGALVAGQRIVSGLDTVLLKTLNGGNGLVGGTIRIEGGGGSVDVDLSSAQTLAQVVRLMNDAVQQAGLTVEVGYDSTGTRLVVGNLDGGAAPITISDVDGDFAATTGLSQTAGQIRGDNLQRRYVSENTRLSDLNAGQGVFLGKLKITNSKGGYAVVNLSQGSLETVQDVIDSINNLGLGVQARINDTGDGLLIVDNSGGSGSLRIEEQGGTAARDLNILGESADGRIDGSYEFEIDVGGSETLESLAARISNETTLASATLLNDGSGASPYRLSVTARVGGALGELIIDDHDSDLGFATLSRAQDARVLFGGSADTGILLSSPDNTFDDVIDGLTINATGISDETVTVTIDRDLEGLTETIDGLVEDYNGTIDRIRELSDWDEDTETAGILLGEGTVQMIENRLFRMFSGAHRDLGGAITRLSELGVRFSGGSRLTFDQEKFRTAYEADPDGVTQFFTHADHGVAVKIKDELQRITGDEGLITRETQTLADQKELLQERVTFMDELLARKRARLVSQFQALESTLAQMQSQQTALANLATLAQSYGTINTGGSLV